MGIKKMISWKKTHRIEAFTMSLMALCACFLVLFVFIGIRMHREDTVLVNDNAVYAEDFTTSLSGVKGQIEQVYVNADRTKCGILVHFDEMSKLSVNAEDYQIFVKGFNVKKGAYSSWQIPQPAGGYCVFGGSGRALIYLSCSKGFGRNAIECIVRSNKTLYTAGGATGEMEELQEKDGSFAKYDQYRIIVNPNAVEIAEVDFLDDLDTEALYKQAIVDGAEGDLRETLQQDVDALKIAYDAVMSYRDNLDNMDVRMPALPEEIMSDSFDTETDEATGQETVRYRPGHVYLGGVDIPWEEQTLSDGSFLDDVTGTQTPSQYFSVLSAQKAIDSETLQTLSSEKWTMKDGTEIRSDSLDENTSTIRANINDYVAAVRDYCNKKKQYQCTDLVSYLQLEYNMKNAGENMSGSFREGIVTAW